MVGEKGVKYGLQVRQPKSAAAPPAKKKPSIFGDDDSDEDQPKVEQQIARQAARKQTDKKVSDMHAAALAEDAAVFDYDSHFDAIQATRAAPARAEKVARQSRYIAGLLEVAESRKREQDVLYERQLAKERAAEDHLFGDTERFVTGAYRRKLEEDAKWKDEQKKIKEEEERNAVEKRGHMGDFYRNLLRNNAAFGTGHPEGRTAAADATQSRPAEVSAVPGGSAAARATGGGGAPDSRAERAPEGEQRLREEGSAAMQAPAAVQQRGEVRAAPAQEPPAAPAPAGAGRTAPAAPPAAEQRSKEYAVAAARERYLARKRKASGAE